MSLFWFCAHLWNHLVRSQMIAQLPLRRLSSFVSVASGPPVAVGQGDPCHVASHLRSALWQGVEKSSCGYSILFNPIQSCSSCSNLFWRLSLPWASALELSCGGDLDNWNGATRFLDFSAVLGQLMAFCIDPLWHWQIAMPFGFVFIEKCLEVKAVYERSVWHLEFCWCRIRSFAGFYNCCTKALDPARWGQL